MKQSHDPHILLEYYKEPASNRDLYLIIMTLFACDPDKLFSKADFKHGESSVLENYSWRTYGILVLFEKLGKHCKIRVVLDGRNHVI